MKIIKYLKDLIENNEMMMEVMDRDQQEHPYSKFHYREYFSYLGEIKLAKKLLRAISNPNKGVEEEYTPYLFSANKLDVFITQSNNLVYKFFNPDYQDSSMNSHSMLERKIQKEQAANNSYLNYQKRLCCFYSVLGSNDSTTYIVLYGESSDYKHTIYSPEVKYRFIEYLESKFNLTVIDMLDMRKEVIKYTTFKKYTKGYEIVKDDDVVDYLEDLLYNTADFNQILCDPITIDRYKKYLYIYETGLFYEPIK